jgi:hypothetical protein
MIGILIAWAKMSQIASANSSDFFSPSPSPPPESSDFPFTIPIGFVLLMLLLLVLFLNEEFNDLEATDLKLLL